ncbi:MAG: STAS domain-containing protein [Mycobacterium sp.]
MIGTTHLDDGAFAIAESWVDRAVVLALTGELDMLTAPELESAIASAASKSPAAMIIDLSKVRFLASHGLSVLVAAYLNITPSAQFGIVAGGVAVRRPLKLTGIDTLVTLFPTLDDALADFSGEPSGDEAVSTG